MLFLHKKTQMNQGQIIMDAIPATITFLLLFMSLILSSVVNTRAETETQTQYPKQIIELGSSLYPTTHPTSWPSPSGLFAFGFYQQGTGFAIGIWLVSRNNKTVVWTANRDDPPLTSDAKLQLTMEGELVLQTQQGQENNNKLIIADSANATASSASMLDSGNFVLYSSNSSVIWQSFDHPTDTILGGQVLPSGGQLLSSSSETYHSTGRFILGMQLDGNLVLYPAYIATTAIDAYWASNTNTGLYHLYLNKTGSLVIRNDSDLMLISTLYVSNSLIGNNNENNMTIYRATLDVDGFFRLYAHDGNDTSKTRKVASFPSDENQCLVKGFCGFNSYCTFDDQKPYCNCLPGFDFIDSNQMTLGCKRNFLESKCEDEKDSSRLYTMVFQPNLWWGDIPYFQATMSQEDDCSSSCLTDCNCWAALYRKNLCMKQEPPLRYVRRTQQNEAPTSAFIKVGNLTFNATTPPRPDLGVPPQPVQPPPIKTTSNKSIVQIVLVILVCALVLCFAVGISSHFMYKIRVLRYKRLLEIGDLGLNEEVALRRFSYSELKKATNGFKQELGKGAFGAVYKGVLYKGRSRRLIAVKRLEKLVEDGEREFQAEMRAIGKTHHKNLVRLLGFCVDGPKRLLVYEYMSNGSLGSILFGDVTLPHWEERVRIALDVARGILYLHEECEAPIIHCDIKPQNILMDDFWTAKISDFGLAKLLMPDQTRTFTIVRGTRGYLAPEWSKNTPITVKADVYSFGIVLLEILCCRRNIVVNMSKPEETLLSGWAYKCLVARELHKLVQWEEVDKNVLENMVKVALWCIQDEPALRPSMKSVVLMLEGVINVAIPPCPTSNSM